MSNKKLIELINLLIDEFKKEELNTDIIQSYFDDCIIIFGNSLYNNCRIKQPYNKAYKHLIKYVQIKLNKLPTKYDITKYVKEPLNTTVLQFV